MPPTIVTGDVATDTINQAQRVVDMDDEIGKLEPNVAPLVVLTQKLRKKTAIAPKVEWLEHEPLPRFDVLSATAASNATALPATNGNYFRVGDLVRSQNGSAYEVTATAAGSLTVSVIGAFSGTAHASGDELFIVSNINAEGAGLRQIKTPQLSNKFNHTEIVRTPYGLTGEEAATKLYGGPDRARLKADAALEHMRNWEQIALTGVRSENLGVAGAPKRTAGGLQFYITTNVTTGVGTLTEAAWLNFLRTGFRYSSGGGGGRKLFLAAPLVVQAIEGFARSNIRVVNDTANTYGVNMKTYTSGQGEVDIVMERWMQDSAVYRGAGFLIDMESFWYMPLRPTKLLEDRQANDADKMEDEFLTSATFMIKNEQRHARITGITG